MVCPVKLTCKTVICLVTVTGGLLLQQGTEIAGVSFWPDWASILDKELSLLTVIEIFLWGESVSFEMRGLKMLIIFPRN